MTRNPLPLIAYLALAVVLIAAATRAETSPMQSMALIIASVITAIVVAMLFRRR
jgi:hypothetical protein